VVGFKPTHGLIPLEFWPGAARTVAPAGRPNRKAGLLAFGASPSSAGDGAARPIPTTPSMA